MKINLHSALIICILWVIPNTHTYTRDTVLVDLIHLPFPIKSIASDSQGTIYLSTTNGLKVFRSGELVTLDAAEMDYIISRNGEILTLREYASLEKMKYGFPWVIFSHWWKHVPGKNWYVSAAEDDIGRVWVANGSNIYIFHIEKRFDNCYGGHSTRGLYMHDGELYMNSYNGIFRNGQKLFDYPPYAEGNIEYFDGKLYVTWGRILSFDPISKEKNDIQLSYEMNKRHVEGITPIVSRMVGDTMWVGHNQGLSYISGDSLYPVLDSMNVIDINNCGERFLIATKEQGLLEKIGKRFIKLDIPSNITYNQILCRDNKYYLPTNNGLVIWDGSSTLTLTHDQGLSNNYTVSAQFDDNGFLWVASYAGINRINLENGIITNYLKNVEFNQRSFLSTSDSLYFGSTSGIYKFDPKDFHGDDIANIRSNTNTVYIHLLWICTLIAIGLLALFMKRRERRRKKRLEEKKLNAEKRILLLQLEQYIFQSDKQINVKDLADYMGVSQRSLYRTFHNYGLTPGLFIKEQRIKKTEYLIEKEGIRDLMKLSQKTGYSQQYLLKLMENLDK